DGDYEDLDAKGRPRARYTIRDGKLDGPAEFYRDGAVTQRCAFRAGLLHGPCQVYEEGVLLQEAHFVDGVIDSEAVNY
ncbi:toxin-antitoxin system YwqK family antitoxin, partial [Leifsonia sp. SIMBA_070]|uniref:toxin-antitoxin system YwqK family antitoxin n=1 Tax=Leifsonia sp. SIMBA_070 TaxID=3085810 RepID=UPI00397C9968